MEHQQLYFDAQLFLINEAEMLDAGRYHEWLSHMSDDIVYQIPIRMTRERNAAPFSDKAWHMKEDLASLKMRVSRIYTEYNWVEDPPSRTRHFLTNFRLVEVIDTGVGMEIAMKCNILLFRGKFDFAGYELLSGEREDVLRLENGQWKLAKRTVWLDHTTLGMSNLGIFL